MHIVHLYDGHDTVYGGSGSVPGVVWDLSRQMVDAGHDVTIIERQWDDHDVVTEHDGVRFHRLPLSTGSTTPREDLPYEMVTSLKGATRLVADRTNFARAALRPLSDYDPDVIHVHMPFAANVLVTLAPWLRDRIVYTAHLGETEKRVVEPRFSPDVYLAKRARQTIALNPSMRAALCDQGVPDENLEIIPNGVDTTQFDDVTDADREHARETFGLDGDVTALFVGTVTPRKGVRELVDAATQTLPATDVDAELVVVGNTELEPAYVDGIRETIATAGIEDDVTITGYVSERELGALYDMADIAVLPSHQEGSSIAVAEALAAALPVLGTRIDGIRQQIDHGTHGLLSEPGDADQLADHLEMLLTDANRRQTMSDAVSERAHELSWEQVTADILSMYQTIQAA